MCVYEYRHTVKSDEIDALGHANNLAYLKWMQDAAIAHSAAQGWPTERYLQIGGGWVVRSHRIEYFRPAYADQQILVRTWVAEMKKVTSLRKYKLLSWPDQLLLASSQTNWAFISIAKRVPRRIPPEVSSAFQLFEERPVSLDPRD